MNKSIINHRTWRPLVRMLDLSMLARHHFHDNRDSQHRLRPGFDEDDRMTNEKATTHILVGARRNPTTICTPHLLTYSWSCSLYFISSCADLTCRLGLLFMCCLVYRHCANREYHVARNLVQSHASRVPRHCLTPLDAIYSWY
jgi:hypothetical protein